MVAPAAKHNIGRYLREAAEVYRARTAVVLPNKKKICFAQLDTECDAMQARFALAGIKPGMRVLTFVRPGFEFVPSIFALFKLGAVPVLIDPGMSRDAMAACAEQADPEAIVGIPLAHLWRRMHPRLRKMDLVEVSIGRSLFLPRVQIPKIRPTGCKLVTNGLPSRAVTPDTLAAILFTSGSTGIPKGVEYTHAQFDAQQEMLKREFSIQEDEIDFVAFPLFALFSAVWGITAVVPDFNPSFPATCDGTKLASQIEEHKVTHAAGSPAIFRNIVSAQGGASNQLKTVRRFLLAGAPVPEHLQRDLRASAPEAEIYTPYGATEALPLTKISFEELQAIGFSGCAQGRGTCVGKPLKENTICIVDPDNSDSPLENPLAVGQIGEVLVSGPTVTKAYVANPEANKRTKLVSKDMLWHRMGDLGYLDEEGRLWFCGRLDHSFMWQGSRCCPVMLEGIFNQHPKVFRSAVVAGDDNRPLLVLENIPEAERDAIAEDLFSLASEYDLTRGLEKIVFVESFPVDVRHNIKIDRLLLCRMVTTSAEALRLHVIERQSESSPKRVHA